MNDRNFFHLVDQNRSEGRYLCIGLDPDLDRIPKCVPGNTDGERVLRFCKRIVDATAHVACCYKPQKSFFDALDSDGMAVQKSLVQYINFVAPHAANILDTKIQDIGNTNKGYVKAIFGRLGYDALTAHNYLGFEAAAPLFADRGKCIFVMCRTSNDGAGEFQDLEIEIDRKQLRVILDGLPTHPSMVPAKMPLYKYVAYRLANRNAWNHKQNCGAVVGATYPKELAEVREIVGSMELLVPGIGAQSKTGDLEADIRAVCEKGRGSKFNLVINSARDIIFASPGEDYADAAAKRAELTNSLIAKYAKA